MFGVVFEDVLEAVRPEDRLDRVVVVAGNLVRNLHRRRRETHVLFEVPVERRVENVVTSQGSLVFGMPVLRRSARKSSHTHTHSHSHTHTRTHTHQSSHSNFPEKKSKKSTF